MSFSNFFFNCSLTYLFKYNSSVSVPICLVTNNVSANNASVDLPHRQSCWAKKTCSPKSDKLCCIKNTKKTKGSGFILCCIKKKQKDQAILLTVLTLVVPA